MPLYVLILMILSSIVIIFLHRKNLPPNFYTLMIFSSIVAYLFSKSHHTAILLSLFIPPYSFAVIGGWNYAKIILNPFLAAAFTFLSLAAADIVWASQYGLSEQGLFLEKIAGVGGAGWVDGLVLIPVTAFLLQIYCRVRLKQPIQLFGASSLKST